MPIPPTPTSGEVRLTEVNSFNAFNASSVTLRDGRVVTAWEDVGIGSGDVRYRVTDFTGANIGGELGAAQNTTGSQSDPAIAALTGGGWVIAWTSTATDSFGDILYRVFDASGAAVGGGLATAGEQSAGRQAEAAVVGTADGGFILAWNDRNATNSGAGSGTTDAVVARQFDAAGDAAGDIVRISGTGGGTFDPFLARNGVTIAIVWDDNALDGIYGRTFTDLPTTDQTDEGTRLTGGGPLEVAANPKVAVTTAGVVTTWTENGQSFYQLGGDVINLPTSSTNVRDVWVTPLAFGGFAIVWTEAVASPFDNGNIAVQIFDTDGDAVGTATTIASADFTNDPSITGMIDGRFFVSWYTQDDPNGIAGRIFDPRTQALNWTGNAWGERFWGTEFNSGDVLDGAGGADRIRAQGGNDSVEGGGGNDTLDGGTGNDSLAGQDGNDSLVGGAGNDTLDGGAGTDQLVGGAGNDTYVVAGADVIVETTGGGVDRVLVSGAFTLAAGLSIEQMLAVTGTTAVSMTGNALAQTMTGNAGGNRLNGGAGNDVLSGGGGNDTLIGGAGNDRLTGGAGADQFVFNAALTAANRDVIQGFDGAADRIALDNAVFTGLSGGALRSAAYTQNNAGLATDGQDRIIYERDAGRLWFDRDGSGNAFQAVHFATVAANLNNLSSADFLVI